MKPKLRAGDARLKIKRNVIDARQTLKNRKVNQQRQTLSDARLKITANRRKPISTKPLRRGKPSISHAIKRGLSRTIQNQDVVKKVVPKMKLDSRKLSSLSGFVSVRNGERVLMEKVTMHRSGMKIAIRNEFAKPAKTKESRKADNTIKITLENPDAQRRQPPAMTHRATRSTALRGRPSPSLRKGDDSLSYQDDQTVTIRSSSLVHEAPTSSRLGDFSENYPSLGHLQDFGLRPMNPAESKTFLRGPVVQKKPHHEELKSPVSLPSPLEGTKILVSNLHPVVIEDDILELFSVLGPVRRARLIGPGKAEVVFVRRDDAILAYQKYNNRDLDGQPMQMKLLLQESLPQSNIKYSWMTDIGASRKSGETLEIEPNILQRALFKGGSTGTSSRPVVFVVKI